MEIVIIDKNAKDIYKKNLIDQGFYLVETIDIDTIEKSIRSHPDIQLAKINENTIVTDPRVYDYYLSKLEKFSINIIKGSSLVSDPYPKDISYNICYDGNLYLHNFNHTDPVIKDLIKKKNKLNIKQGYSKCSICHMIRSIISSDQGIIRSLDQSPYGQVYDKLLIQPGHIYLKDYEYGFIGGASGYSNKRQTLYFLGDIDHHPDSDKIKKFIKKNKENYLNLGPGRLEDLGSLIFLQGEK